MAESARRAAEAGHAEHARGAHWFDVSGVLWTRIAAFSMSNRSVLRFAEVRHTPLGMTIPVT
jgi:hypothetical protein